MNNLNYSYDYLLQQLRLKQVFDVSLVHTAILEPNGELSVLLNPENQALTPSDLNLRPTPPGLAIEIIVDGQVQKQNLQRLNRKLAWLEAELQKKGINNIAAVSFAAVSTNGKLYIDTYDDSLARSRS